MTATGLGVTVACVIFLLVPLLVQRGWPPIPTTLAMVAYTTFVTFVLIGGVQVKTVVAALGSFGGVMLAGLLAWGACRVVHISGMNMDEVHRVNPALAARDLFRSGMRIGRDAMGTMANTLVLAFAGTSLNMMIFIYAYDVSYVQPLNTDFIAIEVIRSLSASIGIVLTVPLVAWLSAWLLKKRKVGAPE